MNKARQTMARTDPKKALSPEECDDLLRTLKARFEKNITRHDRVCVYHNGAESYYAARGFRGSLRV